VSSQGGFNSSVTSCCGGRARGGAASRPREQIPRTPAVPTPLNEALRWAKPQPVLFRRVIGRVGAHNKAVDRHGAAVSELNEMGVHVNCDGDFPVFTLYSRQQNVLGPAPGVDVMAKRSQGWVKCGDRLPYSRAPLGVVAWWCCVISLYVCEIMRVGADSTVCDRSRQRNLSCVFF
jgi:hypothetical protein